MRVGFVRLCAVAHRSSHTSRLTRCVRGVCCGSTSTGVMIAPTIRPLLLTRLLEVEHVHEHGCADQARLEGGKYICMRIYVHSYRATCRRSDHGAHHRDTAPRLSPAALHLCRVRVRVRVGVRRALPVALMPGGKSSWKLSASVKTSVPKPRQILTILPTWLGLGLGSGF